MDTRTSLIPRYANWSRKRTSPWHRTFRESDQPLCGMNVRLPPEWSHSTRPTDHPGRPPARFCKECENIARSIEAAAAGEVQAESKKPRQRYTIPQWKHYLNDRVRANWPAPERNLANPGTPFTREEVASITDAALSVEDAEALIARIEELEAANERMSQIFEQIDNVQLCHECSPKLEDANSEPEDYRARHPEQYEPEQDDRE